MITSTSSILPAITGLFAWLLIPGNEIWLFVRYYATPFLSFWRIECLPDIAHRPEVAGNKTRKPYNAVLQGIDISRANKYVQRKRNAIHLYARALHIYKETDHPNWWPASLLCLFCVVFRKCRKNFCKLVSRRRTTPPALWIIPAS